MKVFKFGGASINSVERIQNVGKIIASYPGEKLLIIISAMGKTTNALEKVAESFFAGDPTQSLELFSQVKESHRQTLKYLCALRWKESEDHLQEFFTEVEWLLHDKPVRDYDYYYDQIVCSGELLSTALVSHYLNENKVTNKWVDVRDIIRTDDNFRDAGILWEATAAHVQDKIVPLFEQYDVVITQGFIGSTDENESTTLGREGSDYSAAIFANLLGAESVTIWKDVDAVMSADPKKYPDAAVIPSLSFTEVIEMAYYGAQVIHPKTIKPLQNKKIPLLVKSFLDPGLPGTRIGEKQPKQLPPIIVDKPNQVLMQFRTKDFSFIEEAPMEALHELFRQIKVKANLTQNTAISLLCCFDDRPDKIYRLASEAAQYFDVELERNLRLLTIRHYEPAVMEALMGGQTIVLEQKTPVTLQALIR
jgi:aspartate kinase